LYLNLFLYLIEILRDPNKAHCPNPECQNVCIISTELNANITSDLNKQGSNQTTNENTSKNNIKVTCHKVKHIFCFLFIDKMD
jgi:hypothetical protein